MKETHRPFKVPLYPIVPIIFIIFAIFYVITSFTANIRDSSFGIILVLSGIPFYFYWKRK